MDPSKRSSSRQPTSANASSQAQEQAASEPDTVASDDLLASSRYRRASQFAQLGVAGQTRIEQSKVLVAGCGALGSMIAERLARSGVGHLRIVDRDWVELTNLQRQTLFTERHAQDSVPKAIAAAEVLSGINSQIELEPIVEDVTYLNIERLAQGVDLILDGTDNFETRMLINDYALRYRVPWVHGGCLGASGQVMSILPGETACFRCLVPELPPRDALPTCDTAGVLGPAIGLIASWQAAEALKILSGNLSAVCRQLIVIDTWNTSCRLLSLDALRAGGSCPACGLGESPFLSGERATQSTILCGKNAVQLSGAGTVDLTALASRLKSVGELSANAFLVRLKYEGYTITCFRDGRVVVEGTTEPAFAKTLVARVLGS